MVLLISAHAQIRQNVQLLPVGISRCDIYEDGDYDSDEMCPLIMFAQTEVFSSCTRCMERVKASWTNTSQDRMTTGSSNSLWLISRYATGHATLLLMLTGAITTHNSPLAPFQPVTYVYVGRRINNKDAADDSNRLVTTVARLKASHVI